MAKNAKHEKLIKLQLIKQHMAQLQQQAEALEQQMIEVESLTETLGELKKIKGEKEILVPLAQGVFAKAKITGSDEFLINVGSGAVVKKEAEETITLMKKQAEEIRAVVQNISEKMGVLAEKAASLEEE